MSFESVYRSRQGAKEIEKLSSFIGSMVIKNKYEAEKFETSESLSEYIKYHGAYTKTDSFADYSLDDRKNYRDYVFEYMKKLSKNYNFSMELVNTLTLSRISILELKYKNNVPEVIDYLKGLRSARLTFYDEKNNYYRQFLGKPKNKDEYITIINMDVGEEGGFVPVEDFDNDPEPNVIYYTKIHTDNGFEYRNVGFLSSWFDEDDELLYDNFYYKIGIYAHELNKTNYPLTYNYYILQQHLNEIIEKNPDFTYLRFIGDTYTPFYLRQLSNYSVIKYEKNILSQTELTYFFKAYDKARKQVVLDYINGFDSKQPLYNLLMIQNLLYYTVINYSSTYIEKYSVGIYTEENCNDILDSYGYSSLKKIKDLDLKQRIVRNLNDLISHKGSNSVLDLILNRILQDPDSELKRFYLEKKFNTNKINGEIKIDTSKGLEDSVSLVLREVPALSINELTSTSDKYHDYDEFVLRDNLWGGIEESDSSESAKTKKELIKKKLLSIDFNSILTKYITLTRTVDILDSQRKIRDAVYLMLKYFDDNESEIFFKQKYDFGDFSATPAALFAALCYLQQMKFYNNPDDIIKDDCVINSSVVFRKMGTLAVDKTTLENNVFLIDGKPVVLYDISPDIASWKLVDYIKENPDIFEDEDVYDEVVRNYIEKIKNSDRSSLIETSRLSDLYNQYEELVEEGALKYEIMAADGYKHLVDTKETIEDYLVRFRFYENGIDLGDVTSNTTFGELFSHDYIHQYPNLINRITKKMQKCYDYNEYQAWCYMLEQSRTNNSISFIFKDFTKFSDYIKNMESETLLDYINEHVKDYRQTNPESVNIEIYEQLHNSRKSMNDICNTQDTLNNLFKTWVDTHFSNLVYQDEMSNNTVSNSSYVEDMKLLLDEFLSVFSQLYSVDYNYTFGNKEIDGLMLQIFYNPLSLHFKQSFTTDIMLSHYLNQRCSDSFDDEIMLIYVMNLLQRDTFVDNINNSLEYDKSTNEYKIDDQFRYEYGLKFKQGFSNDIGITITPTLMKTVASFEDTSCNFIEVLKIITDSGEKIYHEKNN